MLTSTSHVFEDGFALLIGVGYCTDSSLSLPATVNDARALEKVLIDTDQCGYPPSQVGLVVNDAMGATIASKQGILNGLRWLEEHTTPSATVIVYFSGHAKRVFATEPAHIESFYLIPGDCDLHNIADTAISAEELSRALDAISAQKILIILDCCHAGGFDATKGSDKPLSDEFTKFADPSQIYKQLGEGHGYVILLSSSEDQSSWLMEDKKSSIFTHHLLEVLSGKASFADETVITVTRIFDYVSEKVPATVKACYGSDKEQTPQINMRGDRFVAALVPKKKETMSADSQPQDDFDKLYNILSLYIDDLELRKICRSVQIPYSRLQGNSHAERAFSLTEQLYNQDHLPDLEEVLRGLLPKRFSSQ